IDGEHTPVQLAARALHEARGDLVLLTEDHCIPGPGWVGQLCAALMPGRAAVGGVIETDSAISKADWAFWFVDYFRYWRPVSAGPSPTLSVCNVAYREEYLTQIAPLWADGFLETTVHEALRQRFGSLWIIPEAEVRTSRHVRMADAILERYAF